MRINVYVCTPETAEGQLELVVANVDCNGQRERLAIAELVDATMLLNPDWLEITICRAVDNRGGPAVAEPSAL